MSLAAIRDELPALQHQVYLNSGGAGPMPRCAGDAMSAAVLADIDRPRMSLAAWTESDALLDAARRAAASAIDAHHGDVALVQNTTVGVDLVLWGLDWRAGDHLVSTEAEYPGVAAAIAVLADRFGVDVTWISREDANTDLAGAVAAAMTESTRMVVVSHVDWGTGRVFDIPGVAMAAHAGGALCVVDGAQSVGAIPCRPADMGVDAYTFPAQKWLLGPEGLGALWVRRDVCERLQLSLTGYDAGTEHAAHGTFVPRPGARRFENSTVPLICAAGWVAAIDWLSGAVGWDVVFERTAAMHAEARRTLEAIDGVSVVTPPGRQAGLITFTVEGVIPDEGAARMAAAGVILRWVPSPMAFRASTGFFTDDRDIDALANAVRALRS